MFFNCFDILIFKINKKIKKIILIYFFIKNTFKKYHGTQKKLQIKNKIQFNFFV
jgi:hypothetical protein